jgi:hypothetical protein
MCPDFSPLFLSPSPSEVPVNLNPDVFRYSIDRNDQIIRVCPGWLAFAEENSWEPDGDLADHVLGRSLWEFIAGPETRHLYEELLRRARKGQTVGPIPFRCDSPVERRYMELRLNPGAGGEVELESTLIRREQRLPVALLEAHRHPGPDLLRICSMCKKLAVNPRLWVEIEDALAHLKPFEEERMPGLTHGLCPHCHRSAMAELESLGWRPRHDSNRGASGQH